MMPAMIFLLILTLVAAVYVASALVLGWSRRTDCVRPPRDFAPPVSIIKPLSGLDEQLEENLESFYRLDYPAYEIVFSFARRQDPAFSVARRVADRHFDVPTVFVIDSAEPAANSKVNRLAAGVRRARYHYFLFSDGNVRVKPDFLRRVISPFRDPSVGLVSNLFRGKWPESLASRLECLYVNGTLQPATAAISRLLRQPCVVGKSILISRSAFEVIGGFAPIRDYLAEDYLLGVTVRRAGYRVVLSAATLDTTEIAKTGAAAWGRHRRWAIIRNRVAGAAYTAELLASPLPWYVGAVAFSGGRLGLVALASALLLVRYVAELAVEFDGGHAIPARDLPLLPVRDALVAVLFWAGLLGRKTSWRGRRVMVGPRTLIGSEVREPRRLLRPVSLAR
jgi:ceramide glucosyltransferase